jgi:hypothetical protein
VSAHTAALLTKEAAPARATNRPRMTPGLPVSAAAKDDPDAPTMIRLPDGRIVTRRLAPAAQQMFHLAFLHDRTRGYVEVGAGRRGPDGKLQIYTRRMTDHFLRGGASGDPGWATSLLALAGRHDPRTEELFLGVAPRCRPGGSRRDVLYSRFLWLDIDGTEHLDRLWALLERYPPSVVIDSAGSGGRHVYWRLDRLVPARALKVGAQVVINPIDELERFNDPVTGRKRSRVVGYRDPASGTVYRTGTRPVALIERFNARLLHQLGVRANEHGDQVPVGDRACAEHARLLRWAGSINHKTGGHAGLLTLDLSGRGYAPKQLVGGLPDPTPSPARRRRIAAAASPRGPDPYKSIPATDYFWRLAGIEVPDDGWVSCPSPQHPDVKPSCQVGDYRWRCWSCGLEGSIYDLQSLLNGGPTGDQLAGAAFLHAVADVRAKYGELR